MRKADKKASQSGIFLDQILSFPKDGVRAFQDLDFDIKFEQSLFISKSESDLSQVLFYEKRFLSLIDFPSQSSASPLKIPSLFLSNTVVGKPKSSSSSLPSPSNPPRIMIARFTLLVLLDALHELPQNYVQRIKQFDVEGDITTQQHLDRFIDFIDIEEVDYEDVKMRLFSQSFSGEVRK
jgi:hypothetical protein